MGYPYLIGLHYKGVYMGYPYRNFRLCAFLGPYSCRSHQSGLGAYDLGALFREKPTPWFRV